MLSSIELDSLVKQEIRSPVTYPTDWVNSCVCVTKPNGKIRLCLDPKDLHSAIKRPHYVTPTLEDVLTRLNGAKYFSILDARSGYWNIKLDDKSADLTTFNTTFGRYRFNRLPMGVKCAQDEFQRMVDETFGDIPNTVGIADDLIVFGCTEEEHDNALHNVLQRARERGPKFNEDKMILKSSEIPFFRHLIGIKGWSTSRSCKSSRNPGNAARQPAKPTDFSRHGQLSALIFPEYCRHHSTTPRPLQKKHRIQYRS